MKKGLLISIALIFSVAISAQDVEGFINRQMQTYPKSRLLDIYKSCFQDYMGAEHLVSDRQRVKAYLDEELNTISLDDLMPWYYEPCGIDSSIIVSAFEPSKRVSSQKTCCLMPSSEVPTLRSYLLLSRGVNDGTRLLVLLTR